MRVVIQRVKKASVTVENEVVGSIANGLLLLVGVTEGDDDTDIDYLVKKITNMRIFEDSDEKMNLSIIDKDYEILSISQFTLYASTKKGNRPSFTGAAKPDLAKEVYLKFNDKLRTTIRKVEEGIFAADMDVELINDGPVTIIIDSKDR